MLCWRTGETSYFAYDVSELIDKDSAGNHPFQSLTVYQNTLTVDELVEEMGMGRTVFFNKLKSLTGLSPVEFIREMRIKRAAQLLEDRQYNITEVTYMVGMNDSRYFAKCFKATYGVTPSEYRKSCLESKENK